MILVHLLLHRLNLAGFEQLLILQTAALLNTLLQKKVIDRETAFRKRSRLEEGLTALKLVVVGRELSSMKHLGVKINLGVRYLEIVNRLGDADKLTVLSHVEQIIVLGLETRSV